MSVVRLLGPIDVLDDAGEAHVPGTPLRRTLLALLAVEAGRTVDSERLMELAWDGDPPESGLRALRFHISKLRADLPEGVITTVGSGYCLGADTDVGRAENALQGGSDLATALDLWRGDPLAEASQPPEVPEVHRLAVRRGDGVRGER